MVLKLINAEENFVVENMSIGDLTVDFVHDVNTGCNYFNQKVLSDLFGVSVDNVSKRLNKYLKTFGNSSTNSRKNQIRLKTSNKGRKTTFYGFDAVTFLAYRINTVEAINIQNTISSVLDKMFNVVTGKDSINTNKEWLKSQCELKAFQAGKCKEAGQLLWRIVNEAYL